MLHVYVSCEILRVISHSYATATAWANVVYVWEQTGCKRVVSTWSARLQPFYIDVMKYIIRHEILCSK